MCRLFGLTGGDTPVSASFWLLDAPDSLEVQSHREPDGTGLGIFDADGTPRVDKWPIAAYEDREFAQEARHVESTTFVGHIRFASTGEVEAKNTHPFEERGRIFAHNGVVEGLEELERELGEYGSLVEGDTDSERIFALVTRYTDAAGGDVGEGIVAAARWIGANLPVYALNIVLVTQHDLWALRYPDTHRLYVLEREAGGATGRRHLHASSPHGTMTVRSHALREQRAVVVASEPMDEDPGWRELEPGELIHVRPDLGVESTVAVAEPPTTLLTLDDLRPQAAASQRPAS